MALTRKSLKAMGLTEEQVDSVIEMHLETVEPLKAYKDDADKLAGVQAELDKAKADLEAKDKDSWKVKYDALKEEYDGYKADVTNKESKAAKEAAYRKLLKETGVSEKRIDAVMKVTDLSAVELAEDGAVKDAEKHGETIKQEWAEFIGTDTVIGAKVDTPPAGSGGTGMTKESIMAIKDRGERRAAIAANMNLFENNGGN